MKLEFDPKGAKAVICLWIIIASLITLGCINSLYVVEVLFFAIMAFIAGLCSYVVYKIASGD